MTDNCIDGSLAAHFFIIEKLAFHFNMLRNHTIICMNANIIIQEDLFKNHVSL